MKLKTILTIVFVLLSGISVNGQVNPGKVKSFQKEGNAVILKCSNGVSVKLGILQEDIIRVQMAKDGAFEKSMMVEWGYVKDDWPEVEFTVDDLGEQIIIATSALSLRIDKQDSRLTLLDPEGEMVLRESMVKRTHTGADNLLGFDMPADEHFFGFGFMRTTLDARGSKLTWKRGYRWKEATVPYFMSTRGYGFYSNNTFNHEFDFTAKTDGSANDYFTVTSSAGQIDYFLIYGPSFRKILDKYTDLTGKSMLVPKWAFGLEYRFRYLGEQEEFLEIAREFRRREIPADIMALEPGWEDVPYSMIWEWGKTRFPEPEKMMKELDEMGYKLDLWESGLAPFANITDPAVRKTWYDKRRNMIDMGVRMFKQDDPYPRSIISTELLAAEYTQKEFSDNLLKAEQLNNVANTLFTETVFDEFRKQTGERAVVMFHAYNASVASHRWPFQWAGDFQAAYGMLNASLSGHAIVSYDIRNPYAAGWHQGFFTPFSVVDAWAYYREPWLYSESMLESHRIYASLRSRLVPYFYSSLWQAHKSALPIERPMILDWSHDENTHQMKTQFMVGDWFLLGLSDADDAPAGEKVDFWTGEQNGNTGPVYLPEGLWIDYWTGKEIQISDAKWVTSSWPEYMGGHLFVKAGAIIPMGQVKNFIGESEDEVIVLDVYPHKESHYQLYEDDGISYNYEEGEFALTDIESVKTGNKVQLNISARKGDYKDMPERRTYIVKVHSLYPPDNIEVDGELLNEFSDANELVFKSDSKGWYYDKEQKKSIIKIDKGWKYSLKSEGTDPLGIIPLKPSQEKIEWEGKSKIKDSDRLISLNYPAKPIPVISADLPGMPADGISRAEMLIRFENGTVKKGLINASLEGPAFFPGGKKTMEITVGNGKAECIIRAGEKPGMAKLILTGEAIEDAKFKLPVYGEPSRIVIESAASTLISDGSNMIQGSVKLMDDQGNQVYNISAPSILKIEGEATSEKGSGSDTLSFIGGQADFKIKSTGNPGEALLKATYGSLESESKKLVSSKGNLLVNINPPEWIKLGSEGDWIPKHVTVFVNIMVDGEVARNATNMVHLKVYDRNKKLLKEFATNAVLGELDFKDISYDKLLPDYYFEISSDGYESITRKVFENTWDQ